jgi:hypothetical protein
VTDREIENAELSEFARGAKKYNASQRARLAYVVEGILRDRGLETAGADDDALVALAKAELARAEPKKRADAGMITGDLARSMPRYEFIAHWLVYVTKKKDNRGRLGYHVRKVGGEWRILSPVGGGTVFFRTRDPALLFDYARRTQLGPDIRDAEAFRGDAFAEISK